MKTPVDEAVVQHGISISLPIERAFAFFTQDMSRWWPKANTFAKDNFEVVKIEPHEGGRWYERDQDGSETDWGHVAGWNPPHQIILTWQISPQGLPETDPTKASEVEVRFFAESGSKTRVEIEHRHFERHGEEAGNIWYTAMDSQDGGWPYFLDLYANAAH
jgi:hypothetical protein